MKKKPFITLEQAKQIAAQIPTPFHLYDEAGIRANARALKEAFSWNKGFREYFAVKATPNPYILQILKEEGCGCDCATYTELLMAEAVGTKPPHGGSLLQPRNAASDCSSVPTPSLQLPILCMSWQLARTWV